MDGIKNRRVMLTKYSDGVSIMLTWHKADSDAVSEAQTKHYHFSNPLTFSKVEQSINMLVDKWVHVFLSGVDMSAVSDVLDTNPVRFDFLLEHPELNDGDFFTFAKVL